jgi:hypothetical protein
MTMIAYAFFRSSITNGGRLLPNVDGRTFWVRRYRDLFALLVSDLGGADAMEMQFAQAGEAPPGGTRRASARDEQPHAPAPQALECARADPNPELPQRL